MSRPTRLFLPESADIRAKLERLGLAWSAEHLEEFIQEASQKNFSHKELLERLSDSELAWRHDKRVERLLRLTRDPSPKTIDAFDWSHPASIPKAALLNAFKLDFIDRHEHLIFLGPGGVGKTHLASSLGFAACQKEIPTLFTTVADMVNHLVAAQADHSLKRTLNLYTRPRLLILDELGYLPLDSQGRNLFFQVVSKRAETGSMIVTTNKAFKDWTEVFQDRAVATAIAERLIEHGELIKIEGASYRVKKRKQRQLGLDGLENKK